MPVRAVHRVALEVRGWQTEKAARDYLSDQIEDWELTEQHGPWWSVSILPGPDGTTPNDPIYDEAAHR